MPVSSNIRNAVLTKDHAFSLKIEINVIFLSPYSSTCTPSLFKCQAQPGKNILPFFRLFFKAVQFYVKWHGTTKKIAEL